MTDTSDTRHIDHVGTGYTPGIVYCPDPFKYSSGNNWKEVVESTKVPKELSHIATALLAYLATLPLPSHALNSLQDDQKEWWKRAFDEKSLRLTTWKQLGMQINTDLEKIRLQNTVTTNFSILKKMDLSSNEASREKRLEGLNAAERSILAKVLAISVATILEMDRFRLDTTQIMSWNAQLIARYVGLVPLSWISLDFRQACFNLVHELLSMPDVDTAPWLFFSQRKINGIGAVLRILANWAWRLHDLDPLGADVDSLAAFYRDLVTHKELFDQEPSLALDALTAISGIIGCLPEIRQEAFLECIPPLIATLPHQEEPGFMTEALAYLCKSSLAARDVVWKSVVNQPGSTCSIETGSSISQMVANIGWTKESTFHKLESANPTVGLFAQTAQWLSLAANASPDASLARKAFFQSVESVASHQSQEDDLALAQNLAAARHYIRPLPRHWDNGTSKDLLKRMTRVLLKDVHGLAYPVGYFAQMDAAKERPNDPIFDLARQHTRNHPGKISIPPFSSVIGILAAFEWDYGDMTQVQATFESMLAFTKQLDADWHATSLSNQPKLETVSNYLKIITLSFAALSKIVVEETVVAPRRTSSELATHPSETRDLLLLILDIFSHLHFIVRRYKADGFAEWQSLIVETCGWLYDYDEKYGSHFVQDAIRRYLESGDPSQWLYGILLAKHTLKGLETTFVADTLIPQLKFFLEYPGQEFSKLQVFDAAHDMVASLALANLASPEYCSEYLKQILDDFPEKSGFDALKMNFTDVVNSLATHGHQEPSWGAIQMLCHRIDELAAESSENQDSTALIDNGTTEDLATLQRMAQTKQESTRNQLILLLFDQLKSVDNSHLNDLLQKISNVMLLGHTGLEGEAFPESRSSPLWQSLYNVISAPKDGLDYIKRNKCVVWFMDLQKGNIPITLQSKL
jgi:hypothetical protein